MCHISSELNQKQNKKIDLIAAIKWNKKQTSSICVHDLNVCFCFSFVRSFAWCPDKNQTKHIIHYIYTMSVALIKIIAPYKAQN